MGCLGPLGAKRKLGESVFESVERKLGEDTGLRGEASFVGVLEARMFTGEELYLHYSSLMFRVSSLKGEVKRSVAKGENEWLTEEEFYKKKNIMTGMEHHFRMIKGKRINFVELKQYLNKDGKFLRAELIREKRCL